jgi:hypothetical protein
VLQEGLFPLSQVQRKAMPMGLGLLLNSMRRWASLLTALVTCMLLTQGTTELGKLALQVQLRQLQGMGQQELLMGQVIRLASTRLAP